MKKFYLIIILLNICIFSQTEYVEVENPVYDFLERMETQQVINNYNSFLIPKTRNDIAEYLKEVISNIDQLDKVDKQIVEDLKVEFEYELYKTLDNAQSLLGKENYNILSEKEKYLYFYEDTERFSLFINILGEGELIFSNDFQEKKNISTSLGLLGGEIRGTILNKFGFYLKGSNGYVFGNKEAAFIREDLGYNLKLTHQPEEGFFDETEGYLTADFDLIKLKFGRDRLNLGYGTIKPLINNNSPVFDYLALNISYKFFSFSYFHGKLLGNVQNIPDSITGGGAFVPEKYIGYHRIGFNISKDIDFGIGELIIYGDRPIDLSYLNPFSFYKSVEHQNQDRDNSMLFFDFNNNSIKGLKLSSTLLIDDISFGKLGTGWWGNQTLFSIGLYSANLYKFFPLDFRLEYLRIDPYTLSHRLSRNSFTNFGYNIGSFLQPNSELFFAEINYRFTNRLNFNTGFAYTIHGANPLNPDGSVMKNVGGDILLGHRLSDSETVNFLEGYPEYGRTVSVNINYEPFNRILLNLNLRYINQSLQIKKEDKLETFLSLSVKL